MKISVLGSTSKGTFDFELQSDNEYGYTVKCEDGGGIGIFNNIQYFRWLSGGLIVYMDPCPLKGDGQFNFSRFKSIKITKAKKVAEERFENHYWKGRIVLTAEEEYKDQHVKPLVEALEETIGLIKSFDVLGLHFHKIAKIEQALINVKQ